MIHIDHPNIPINIRVAFAQKVQAIADYLLIDPNWLMQVMYAESKLNHKAQNIQKGRLIAAGLLQWTKASGTEPHSVLHLNHLQQLDKVKSYFTPYRGKMHSYFDVYMVTFFPMGMGKPNEYVFATKNLSAALIAKQNPAINKNRDGKITMAEFKKYVWDSTPKGVRGLVFTVKDLIHSMQESEKIAVKAIEKKITQSVQEVKQKTKAGMEYVEQHPESVGKAVGGIGALIGFFYSFNI